MWIYLDFVAILISDAITFVFVPYSSDAYELRIKFINRLLLSLLDIKHFQSRGVLFLFLFILFNYLFLFVFVVVFST